MPERLSACQQLNLLDISDNAVNDIKNVALPPKLRNLQMNNNQITQISAAMLSNMKLLSELGLQGNQLNEISSLENLTSLSRLDISKNKIKKMPVFGLKSNVKEVLAGFNSLKSISEDESFYQLKHLAIIDVQSNLIA
jgi:internalin A